MKRNFELKTVHQDNYTLPILKKNSKGWFVEFYFDNKRIRKSFNLNRIKDLDKRESEFNMYKKHLEAKLLSGWNPNDVLEEEQKVTFEKAIDFAFEKVRANIRPTTLKAYRSFLKHILENDKYITYKDILIEDVKKKEVVAIVDDIEIKNKLTPNTRNRIVTILKILFNVLVEKDLIEYNVVEKIKFKKTEKQKVKIPTPSEIKQIKEYLNKQMPGLWQFTFFLFQSGLRPNEIINIKLHMIDLDKRIIIIPKEFVKTKVDRIVPIDQPMFKWLEKIQIQSYSKNSYLFGKLKVKRDFNRSTLEIGISSEIMNRQNITHFWSLYVKEDLEIDVNIYSFKHLRANQELINNNNLEQAKTLFGHSNIDMTEVYANHKDDFYIEKLKSNTLNLNNLTGKQRVVN